MYFYISSLLNFSENKIMIMVLRFQTSKGYISLKLSREFGSMSVSTDMQVVELYGQNYALLSGISGSHSGGYYEQLYLLGRNAA
jgi:hypothetical protein